MKNGASVLWAGNAYALDSIATKRSRGTARQATREVSRGCSLSNVRQRTNKQLDPRVVANHIVDRRLRCEAPVVRARLSPLEQIHHVTRWAHQRPWIDSDHARVVAGRSGGERAWLDWAPAAGVVDAAHEGALVDTLAHERGARVSSIWELPRSSVVYVATVAAHGEPRLPKAVIGHLRQICTAVRRLAKVEVDGGKEQDPSTFIS